MPSSRRWLRYHYHCEACDGSWLAEGDVVVEADCPFCKTRDVFAYKSDDRVYAERAPAEDAAAVAKKLAATMRKAVRKTVGKPAPAPRAKVRRAG